MEFNIGPRMVKTGLAVALTLIVTDWLGLELEIVAAIAAVLAMQPSIMRSYNYIKEVVVSNGVGLLFALLGTFLLGTHPLSVGVVVIISIAINIRLGLNKTVSLTVLTIITLMLVNEEGLSLLYVLTRLSLVTIGVVSAFIVNVVIFPPDHQKNLFSLIKQASEKMNFMLRVLPNKTMSIPEIKKENEEVEKLINDAKDYFEIISDERSRILIKDRVHFYRNIVIFKHMIRVLGKKQNLIEQLERHIREIEEIPGNKAYLIKKLVKEMNSYSENILLLYEDKIILNTDLQKETKTAMQITINNLIEELQGSEFGRWNVVFPIANSIIELFFELDKLERLVRINEIKEGRG
ncbi:aromatic acid exporter family protein [Virgibacillus kekensis]|uniref:Aromatic acid exporter family protein n=1 Tax=Virgibacillus kekensis TaxID=202261 RepID=A0ABV9DQA5_9BACI